MLQFLLVRYRGAFHLLNKLQVRRHFSSCKCALINLQPSFCINSFPNTSSYEDRPSPCRFQLGHCFGPCLLVL
jgi:hypothetical protein